MHRELRQRFDDMHRLQRYRDHPQNEVEDVILIPHLLRKRVVIIGDTGVLIDTDTAALDYPIKGRLAIDHILLGLQWDARNGDAVVVVDRGLVLSRSALFPCNLAVSELDDALGDIRRQAHNLAALVWRHLLIAHVQLSKLASRLHKGLEVIPRGYARNAWQLLLQVVSVGGAVVGAVQQAVNKAVDLSLHVSPLPDLGATRLSLDPVIAQLLHHINTHLADDLSLEHLAQLCNLSKFSLMRKFKQFTGMSLHQYIVKKRLLQARYLISLGMEPYRAALDAGFNNYSNFSRSFTSFFGENPGTCARRYKKKSQRRPDEPSEGHLNFLQPLIPRFPPDPHDK